MRHMYHLVKNPRLGRILDFLLDMGIRLEFCTLRGAREGNDVADVLHACDEQDETLETKAETGMRT